MRLVRFTHPKTGDIWVDADKVVSVGKAPKGNWIGRTFLHTTTKDEFIPILESIKEAIDKLGTSVKIVSRPILDPTCGAKTMWFNKRDPHAVFCDNRYEDYHAVYGGEAYNLSIHPDIVCDFTSLPFPDESFYLVVFDPPDILTSSNQSWMVKKFGKLQDSWPKMLHDGFAECMRVLKPYGTLIFKWAETDVPARQVWEAIGKEPLFGHKSGKSSKTFWATFMKFPEEGDAGGEDCAETGC